MMKWAINRQLQPWLLLRHQLRPVFFAIGVLTFIAPPVASQVSVITEHNDNARTGQNVSETFLTPDNVLKKYFGKLFTQNVDGQVVAQPLYLPGVSIPGAGTHNVVYVATQHDSVFAFDADNNLGGNSSPLWTISFINPNAGITTESGTDEGCGNGTGFSEIGIMGTPAIDNTTNTLYVVAKTDENGSYIFRLHALDVTTGQEKFGGPALITGSVVNSFDKTVSFVARRQAQRPGLLLLNGNVYIGFGSNGCDFSAHGWILSYDAGTLQQTGVFNTTPDVSHGGSVWQSGTGLAGDSDGNVYFATAAIGDFDADTGGMDFGDTVLKLQLSGGALGWVDYFTPYNQNFLNASDLDLGSGGVVLLPDQDGPNPHLLLAAGKESVIYLVNRDNMGQYNSATDDIVQELPTTLGEIYSAPIYWNGMVYYIGRQNHPMQAFSLSAGMLSTAPVLQSSAINDRGLPSLSADGATDGIIWLVRGPNYTNAWLTALNATNLAITYSSNQPAGNRDILGPVAHFATPTITNGKVYVGTTTQLAIYGLMSTLKANGGSGQTGAVGTTLPRALSIKAIDAYSGNIIPGVTVTFSDGGAGGSFGNPAPVSGSDGVASTTYTLPGAPGVVSIAITATGFISRLPYKETAQ
jgi:hypothetical protein